jgi:hypothetical protein
MVQEVVYVCVPFIVNDEYIIDIPEIAFGIVI